MRLGDAIEGYLLARTADGLAKGTLGTYKWALHLFSGSVGEVDVEAITLESAQIFMASISDHYKNKSRENVWIALKAFDKWRAEELKLPHFFSVARPPTGYDQPVPFTEDEMKRLLKAAQFTKAAQTTKRKAFAMRRHTAARDTALLLLMLDTCLRAGEVCRLVVGDVDLKDGAVQVRAWGSGKKTKTRVVYLGARARKAVWRIAQGRKADAPLFVSNDRPMTPNSIMKLYHHLGHTAEVANCHPHRMRHTGAIQFLRNGGDVFSLQRMLGHSSLEMSRRYVLIANTDLQDTMFRASPADNWKL
jgi:integrase/recombinase XerD